jgi:hypothetical protein
MTSHPRIHFPRWALPALILAAQWTTARAALEQPGDARKLFGIGIVLTADGDYPVVAALATGGAAERDGRLKVGDHIAGVAEGDDALVDCKGKTVHQIITLTRGKMGSTVRIQAIPAGATDPSKREVIALVRTVLNLTDFSSDEQAKLAAIVNVFPATLPKVLAQDMERRVQQVVQAAGLDESGSNAIEKAAAKAVDQCMQSAVGRISDYLQGDFQQFTPADRQSMFSAMEGQIATIKEDFVRTTQRNAGVWPVDEPAWAEGLKETLTPAQAAAWAGAQAKREKEVEGEIADYLNGVASYGAEAEKEDIDPQADEFRGELNLPKDRLDKLDALEKSVADGVGAAARATAEKALLGMADDERKAVLGRKRYFNWVPPLSKTKWNEGFAKLFSPDDLKRMQMTKDDRQNQRARAMGKVLLALMDDRVAFTAAQRQQLEPIAERLVEKVDDVVSPNSNSSISSSTIYGAAAGGSDDEIKAILDPIQWRHWQDTGQLKNLPDDNEEVENTVHLPGANAPIKSPSPAPGPEDEESAISDFLAAKSDTERQKVFAEKILKAEDAARVLHLPQGTAERLRTAACGSADALLARWNSGAEQVVHSSLGDATPETVKQRLAGIQSYQLGQAYQNNGGVASPREALLDQTLKAELSPAQRKAWKVETDARRDYRVNAVAGWITTSFAQTFALSPDQKMKMEPMIGSVLSKYAQGIGSFFSDNSWYLETFYMYLPVAGIPDKDLQSLLNKEQLHRWNASQQRSVASSYWTNIVQNSGGLN